MGICFKKFSCPNEYRMKQYNFILCKAKMRSDCNYAMRGDALKAMCAQQAYCPRTHSMEIGDNGAECYMRYQAAQKAD